MADADVLDYGMETDCIHYSPDGFAADGWLGPRDGSGVGWPFAEVAAAHASDERITLAPMIWAFIRQDGLWFTAWLFEVDGWIEGDPAHPYMAYPIMALIGRTFDGLREIHGAPCFSPDLRELAAALLAMDDELTRRGWVPV